MAKKKVEASDLEELGLSPEDAKAQAEVAPEIEVPKASPIVVSAPAVSIKDKSRKQSAAVVGAIQPVKYEREDGEDPALPPSENAMVELLVDEELHINGQRLYGLVKVPLHQARSIIPMLQSKKRADIEVFTGRSFRVERTLNNRLVVRELDEGES